MRTRLTAATALAMMLLWTGLAAAQDLAGKNVKVRLLQADNSNTPTHTEQLEDVLPQLKSMLRFSSYRLVTTSNMTIQMGATTSLDGFSMRVTGLEGRTCTVEISAGGKRLMQTKLRLMPGRPVILGGFPKQGEVNPILVVSLL